MNPRVFLSYARPDQLAVKHLHSALKRFGFDPWMDVFEIALGTGFEQRIERQITQDSDAAVVVLSTAFRGRGYRQFEARTIQAAARDRRQDPDVPFIYPLLLENCEIPEWLRAVDVPEEGGRESIVRLVKSLGLAFGQSIPEPAHSVTGPMDAPFVGRRNERDRLHEFARDLIAKRRGGCITIDGIGGAGKSFLSSRFAWELAEWQPWLAVVHLNLATTQVPSLRSMQRALAQKIGAVTGVAFSAFKTQATLVLDGEAAAEANLRCSKAWLDDLRGAVRAAPFGVFIILDEFEQAGDDGSVRAQCHNWIVRMLDETKDLPVGFVVSGRDVADGLRDNALQPGIILSGLDKGAAVSLLEQRNVQAPSRLKKAIVEQTACHPQALDLIITLLEQRRVDPERLSAAFEAESYRGDQLARILRYSWDPAYIDPARSAVASAEREVFFTLAMLGPWLKRTQVAAIIAAVAKGGPLDADPLRVTTAYPNLFSDGCLEPYVSKLLAEELWSERIDGADKLLLYTKVQRYTGARLESLEATNDYWSSWDWYEVSLIEIAMEAWARPAEADRRLAFLLVAATCRAMRWLPRIAWVMENAPGAARLQSGILIAKYPESSGHACLRILEGIASSAHATQPVGRLAGYGVDIFSTEARRRQPDGDTTDSISAICVTLPDQMLPVARELLEMRLLRLTEPGNGDVQARKGRLLDLLKNGAGIQHKARESTILQRLVDTYIETKQFGDAHDLLEQTPVRSKFIDNLQERVDKAADSWISAELATVDTLVKRSALKRDDKKRRRTRKRSDLLDAFDRLRNVLEVSGDHVGALNRRIRVLRRLERFDECAEAAKTLLRIDPASARSLVGAGEAFLVNGDLDRAYECFDTAERILRPSIESDRATPILAPKQLARWKTYGAAINRLAETKLARGDLVGAIENFGHRIDLGCELGRDRCRERKLIKHALVKRGFARLIHGQPAQDDFDRAIAIDGQYSHGQLGRFLCDPSDQNSAALSEAGATCRRLIEAEPDRTIWRLDRSIIGCLSYASLDEEEFEADLARTGNKIEMILLAARIECCRRARPGPQLERAKTLLAVRLGDLRPAWL